VLHCTVDYKNEIYIFLIGMLSVKKLQSQLSHNNTFRILECLFATVLSIEIVYFTAASSAVASDIASYTYIVNNKNNQK